ncbi:NADH-quinone oxidoreductase subunit L [Marinobacter fuscus]|uniref:Probable inorganic carbon transporter subunit DabB n=1 Tax=Marinobacter fuscus TaxID=2109942 RepID=A0A2T1KR49_9GAMM|nr:proton-conducting transporter membrane subunit [Marinobacter fuscus]PSF12163.1 NADH-quinone oxidoreductase subunit L [Marinobacter fuscus]
MTPITTSISYTLILAWLTIPICLFMLAGFANWTKNTAKRHHCWRLAERLLQALLMATLAIGAALLAGHWGLTFGLPGLGNRFGLQPDGLAVWMSLMVALVAWSILRYARDYLRNDSAFNDFLPWFLLTVASVLVLVFTDHLLVLAGAWVGVSLALHQLLTLYADRPQARLAAAQKFIASRLGDLSILGAVLLVGSHYGSFRLPEIYAMAGQLPAQSMELTVASVLLAIAAALKCAQLPFHGWLIRMMEAPTPVSALLHAGVVNLGGFLWLRMFPVFDGFTPGHLILLVVGGSTAVVGVFTMMTQSSAKHTLVWSTNAQMGFMLFEIALGAYTLALLHLLAHSVYKAHSFLAVGRTVKVSRPVHSGGAHPLILALALGTASIAAVLLWLAPELVAHKPVLAGLLILAVAATVLGAPAPWRLASQARVALLAISLVPLYGFLNLIFGAALPAANEVPLPGLAALLAWATLAALVALSLMLFFLPQSRVAQLLQRQFSQGLHLDRPFEALTRRWAHAWLDRKARQSGDTQSHASLSGEKS